MNNYTKICSELEECGDMGAMIDNLMKSNSPSPCGGSPIQPDSNIGNPGAIKDVTAVSISQEEDGSIKVTTDAMCVKLHTPVIVALKKFLDMTESVQGEE